MSRSTGFLGFISILKSRQWILIFSSFPVDKAVTVSRGLLSEHKVHICGNHKK